MVRAARKQRFAGPDPADLDRDRETSMADEGGASAALVEAGRRDTSSEARPKRRTEWTLVAWALGTAALRLASSSWSRRKPR
jgi:hypothetical protein